MTTTAVSVRLSGFGVRYPQFHLEPIDLEILGLKDPREPARSGLL